MDGAGHKIFAPIFGCGVSTLLAMSGFIPLAGNTMVTALIATVCTELTATLPDADLIALKPKAIIKGTARKRYSKKYKKEYYYITMSEEEFKRRYKHGNNNIKMEQGGKGVYVYYDRNGTNSSIMKHMALIFKAMGIQKHRGWQSHSPVLWVPFWVLVVIAAYMIPDVGQFLGAFILGMGLGWISHLVGDLLTLDGLPLIPRRGRGGDYRIAPMGKKIFNHRIFGFAKASNKVWIAIVCFAFINLFSYLLAPELFILIWSSIGNFFKIVLPFLGDMLSGIWSFFMHALGSGA